MSQNALARSAWFPPDNAEVVQRGGLFPLGTYRTPDGQEVTALAFPQPMRDALDALGYAVGMQQDPAAPQGYVSQNALIRGGQGLAESAMVGGIAAPKPANALAMGIKAYHGSPHKFDKFSMDAIGTGEGNQAFGHGLYFAESPSVARSYRDTLSSGADPTLTFEGRSVGNVSPASPPEELAARLVAHREGDVAKTIADVREAYGKGGPPPAHQRALELLEAQPERFAGLTFDKPGHLYQVDIDADPQQFLDWDKPLGEQSEAVRKALADYEPEWQIPDLIRHRMSLDARTALDSEGGDISRGAADRRVSEMLRDRGIAGIRYLDQGSRSAGEGSRNYVVFDDNLITIEDILAANPMAGAVPLAFPAPDDRRRNALLY